MSKKISRSTDLANTAAIRDIVTHLRAKGDHEGLALVRALLEVIISVESDDVLR
jgi:hypothetical protein